MLYNDDDIKPKQNPICRDKINIAIYTLHAKYVIVFHVAAAQYVMFIHANVVKYVIQFNVNVAKDVIVFLANAAQDVTVQNVYVAKIAKVIHANVVLNGIYQ